MIRLSSGQKLEEFEQLVLIGALPNAAYPLKKCVIGWHLERRTGDLFVEPTVEHLQREGLIDKHGKLTSLGSLAVREIMGIKELAS